MPPSLDIYVFSNGRDRATLNSFIDRYVDRPASEQRGDEELMILRVGAETEDLNAWEWEPAKTLTHILNRALDHPRRAFVVYLRTCDSRCDSVTLGFTSDDRVVLGLSVDDPLGDDRTLDIARSILLELGDGFEADAGLILAEEAPPITPSDMQHVARPVLTWSRAHSS